MSDEGERPTGAAERSPRVNPERVRLVVDLDSIVPSSEESDAQNKKTKRLMLTNPISYHTICLSPRVQVGGTKSSETFSVDDRRAVLEGLNA